MTQKLYLIIVLALLAGCEFQVDVLEAATPTGFVITSTLPPTLTPAPSETPLTPGFDKAQPESPTPMAPRATPVEGTTSTQVNVRAEPSTASDVLGTILPNTKVRIVGKDPGDNWWLILYEQGVDGKGWVTAQYITT
ncbi:MAG TPA: SH3 domain-containing protein, partial [Anaerolineales bacterium]|nr:SH3 domain-containing protein [Anaerolineales bacterium]